MTEQQAMRMALEALEQYHGYMEPLTTVFGGPRVPAEQSTTGKVERAITALRQALEQPADEIDWKDQYEKQKRRAEMWVAKYEKDIGPVEKAVPMQQSEALKLADALEQDTRGYEPVTDAARELRRLYAENQRLKAQPADEPVAWQLSPTDIYDFAGWLTTRKGVMTVGSSCEAGPMAEAVGEYLKTFPERFNTRPQPAAPEFYHHVVKNEGDWSEWVNPDNDSYMMKCCDCGLVHEMQFKVAKYSEGDECEFVDDPDLQPVFRARRAEEAWQEKDTAHRAGGLPQPAADRATELLKRCENEMRYAGWDKFEADNTARNGVYEQVKQYLEKNT